MKEKLVAGLEKNAPKITPPLYLYEKQSVLQRRFGWNCPKRVPASERCRDLLTVLVGSFGWHHKHRFHTRRLSGQHERDIQNLYRW